MNTPAAGTYDLQWRYANGTSTNRTATVSVGGITQASGISFAGTGAWTTWALSSMYVEEVVGPDYLPREWLRQFFLFISFEENYNICAKSNL